MAEPMPTERIAAIKAYLVRAGEDEMTLGDVYTRDLLAEVDRLQRQILIAREVAVAMSQNLRTADATMYSACLLANLDGRDTPYGRTYDSLHAKNEKLREELETRSAQFAAEVKQLRADLAEADRHREIAMRQTVPADAIVLERPAEQAVRALELHADLGGEFVAAAVINEDGLPEVAMHHICGSCSEFGADISTPAQARTRAALIALAADQADAGAR